MRIGIIGAGITGLALAAALQRDFDVEIYEKADHVRAGGSGITLAPNGLAALDSLGLGEDFRSRQNAQTALRGGLRDPSGAWLSHIPESVTRQSLALDRAELHQLLLDHISPDCIHTGSTVTEVNANTGEVHFAAGGSERFDLVVGADGIRSAARRSCFNDPGIRYAGYNAWRGITEDPLSPDLGFETWGTQRRFGVAPLHDGRTYWFAVASGVQANPGEQRLSTLEDTFSNWHEPIPALLQATSNDSIQHLPICELAAPLRSYYSGRVVLVGDAAHAMTPNLGQGACQGLEDVAVLSRLLQSNMDLSLYSEHRLRRSQQIARQSRIIGQAVHSGGKARAKTRNWVLRHVPDSATAQRTQAVTDWHMPV